MSGIMREKNSLCNSGLNWFLVWTLMWWYEFWISSRGEYSISASSIYYTMKSFFLAGKFWWTGLESVIVVNEVGGLV